MTAQTGASAPQAEGHTKCPPPPPPEPPFLASELRTELTAALQRALTAGQITPRARDDYEKAWKDYEKWMLKTNRAFESGLTLWSRERAEPTWAAWQAALGLKPPLPEPPPPYSTGEDTPVPPFPTTPPPTSPTQLPADTVGQLPGEPPVKGKK